MNIFDYTIENSLKTTFFQFFLGIALAFLILNQSSFAQSSDLNKNVILIQSSPSCPAGRSVRLVSPSQKYCKNTLAAGASVEGGWYLDFVPYRALGQFERNQFAKLMDDMKIRNPKQWDFYHADYAGYCFICYTTGLPKTELDPEPPKKPICPNGYKPPYSGSDPICYTDSSGDCPPAFPYKHKHFNHCRKIPW